MVDHYDAGEGDCPGDPELTKENLPEVERLQYEYDRIAEIEDDDERLAAAEKLVEVLNG